MDRIKLLNMSTRLEDYSHANKMNYHIRILRRFWSKVNIPKDYENECWLWTAGSINGYGQFYIYNKPIGAHRFSYECYNGPILNGSLIRHSCDTPSCVSPYHLLNGTHYDNKHDAIERGRYNKTINILTENDVKDILNYIRKDKINNKKLATMYNVSIRTIYNISRGFSWYKIYNQLVHNQNINTYLTEEKVKNILNILWEGHFDYKELSIIYNVHPKTIRLISIGKTWKHLWEQLTKREQIRIKYSKGLNSSLKNSDFKLIAQLYKTKKVTQADLAVMFNITNRVVARIIRVEKKK